MRWHDARGDTIEATRAIVDMICDGVVAFFGPEGTCNVEAIVAQSRNIPMFSYVSRKKNLNTRKINIGCKSLIYMKIFSKWVRKKIFFFSKFSKKYVPFGEISGFLGNEIFCIEKSIFMAKTPLI